jgi:hypothetical protein
VFKNNKSFMIESSSLKLGQTSTIYDKQCPVCARFSLEDAQECWNCHFEFVSQEVEEKPVFSLGEKILVSLTLVLVGMIALLRYLMI